MDIVIPYRIPPHGTHELQFALRSACEHYDVGRVFLLGDKPDWCTGVEHVPASDESRDPVRNVMRKLRSFVRTKACPDDFALWNDDMYVLQQGVSLEPTTDSEKTISDLVRLLIGKYRAAALATARWVGVRAVSAELHKPIVINKAGLWLLFESSSRFHGSDPVLIRTVYVNNGYDIGADAEPDRLAITADDVKALMKGPWFASRDTMATAAEFVLPMRKRFPDKCRFER